jgi:hypothetical protein
MSDRHITKQPPESTLAALLALRELLADPKHWAKFVLRCPRADGGQAYCLLGGIYDVCNGTVFYHRTMSALCDAAPLWCHGALSLFNDSPGTKHADVVALIDRAIARQ